MSIRSLTLAFTGILLATSLFTQTPSYYHYSAADGLASSTVYQIIQDRDGFIWFATANGLSKFDGKQFTTYRTIDGLNSNSIISIAEGYKGEIYIGNFEKGINIIKDGIIKNYISDVNGRSIVITYLMIDPSKKNEQTIFAYGRYGIINIISEKKSTGLTSSIIKHSFPHILKLEKLQNGNIMALTTTGLYQLKDSLFSKVPINGLSDTEINCLANFNDGSYVIGTKGSIYKIKNNTVIDKIQVDIAGNNDVVTILCDRNNNIWFSIMNKGFYFIASGSNKIIEMGSKLGLQNTLVNTYFEDKEGNIWVSTFGKGVYCLNNLYLTSYNESDGLSNNNVYSIANDKYGNLIFGTFNGISVLKNESITSIKKHFVKSLTEYIYSIKNVNNEFYVGSPLMFNEIIDISFQGMKLHVFNGLSFCKLKNGLYLIGSRTNSIRVSREFNFDSKFSTFFVFGDSLTTNRIKEIFEDTKKNTWIATSLGLCKASIRLDKTGKLVLKKSFFPTNPVLNSRTNSIYQDNNNNVWFAGEMGIARYNLQNDSVYTYTKINGYDLSSSTSIVSDNKNRMWIGNMKGLYLFSGDSVKYLNRQTGLPSNEVLSLSYNSLGNSLIIGTSNGISFLDISLFNNYNPSPPSVKITSIKAGDSVYTSYDNLVFKPKQHDISIHFKALNFSSPGSVKYKYNLNNEWIATDYDFLNFITLKAGIYKVRIMAKAQNTDWGEPYFLSFRVLPRFVETIWFDLLILLLILVAGVLILTWSLRMNTRKIRKELELTERINELKHKALSAMMNPHFIANSLNSMQYLVNSHQYEEANEYVAMMGQLMRKNLDTAGMGFIRLSEEITRLKLYLDIEKLRFQEKFTYEIIEGADVDPNIIMIPNMIIQPFAENSLWHGIINSGNNGFLTISFNFEDVDIDSVICRSLIIKITDNGIGIKEAKKHKKEDHISKGIQIIEERLSLLSAKMQLPQPIVFEDLSSQDNDSQGTEVIISLPPQLYKISIPEVNPPTSTTV